MMCRSFIPLYGLLLSGTPSASSEMYPDPAIYCGNYADEVGCRERHSGGLQCRDLSKCKGLIFNKEAVGVLTLLSPGLQMTGPEYKVQYQSELMVARQAIGMGQLRAECACKIVIP